MQGKGFFEYQGHLTENYDFVNTETGQNEGKYTKIKILLKFLSHHQNESIISGIQFYDYSSCLNEQVKPHFVKKIKGFMNKRENEKIFLFKNSNQGKEDSFIGFSRKSETLL